MRRKSINEVNIVDYNCMLIKVLAKYSINETQNKYDPRKSSLEIIYTIKGSYELSPTVL